GKASEGKGPESKKPESKGPETQGESSNHQSNNPQGKKPQSTVPETNSQQDKQQGPQQSHNQQNNPQPVDTRQNDPNQDDNRQDNSHPTPTLADLQRDTADARDRIASSLGVARAAYNQAFSQLPAITRSVREAHGAVLGTNDAVTRAQQRVQDTQRHHTNLNQQLTNLRRQRNDLVNAPTPDPVAVTDLDNRITTVESAVTNAARAVDQAQTDLAATQVSQTAAVNAHNSAIAARDTAQRALIAANNAVQTIQQQLNLANNAVTAATNTATATTALTNVRDAERVTDTNRNTAKNAITTVTEAKDKAKEAAKQGGVEKAITQLSSLPPGAELTIDTLGPLDDVAAMLAELTGAPVPQVTAQLTNLGPDGLAAAINRGTLDVTTPTGTVAVRIHADLHRPPDSRYAPQQTQPSTTSHDSSGENTNPLSSSTSSSLPLRIPVLFISPIDAVGGAMRPMVYVGGVAKRAQKFDSGTTSSSSTSTPRTRVPTTMSITASRAEQPSLTASVQVALNLPAITRTNVLTPNPVPEPAFTRLNPAPVRVPPSFVPVLGNSADSAQVLRGMLLTQNNNPANVSVNDMTVPVTPTAPPTITLVGTTGVDQTHSNSHSNSWSTTRGSDATFGAGVYGGLTGWFLGAFTDFSTGATDGTNPATEHSTSHTAGNTELVYRIDRPMRIGDGNGVQDTVSSTVRVPVPLARSLGLALPPHLSGSEAVDLPGGNQPNVPNVYWFGKDTITWVDTNAVTRDLSQGLGAAGQAAVNTKFGSQNSARDAIYNAMHGGDQVTWQEGGRTHFLDIYARPVPPRNTAPSALTEASAEDKHADQFRRTYDSKRSA
ncbi:MAG: hypothetical protein M3422_14310, partial [Actinomycetota bacterium]|nr:hypothetical protein [Actinomycetota bacterium]